MSSYDIVSHAELGDVAFQVYDLCALCFATYPGVLAPSEAHRRWYVRRPGMSADMSSAAVWNGTLVANVFVTQVTMRLGGALRSVGILDTVMTHPAHRRRGLARALLERSIDGMRAAKSDGCLLYTLEGSMPYHLYRQLGFRPVSAVDYLVRDGDADGHADDRPAPLAVEDDETVRAFLNEQWVEYEGFIPYDQNLWRWRKRSRPAELRADHLWWRAGGEISGFATVCHAPIVSGEGAGRRHVITDLAFAPAASAAQRDAMLVSLLAGLPGGERAVILSPRAHVDEARWLRGHGFAPDGTEMAMALPFAIALSERLAAAPELWYPVAESIIGV